MIKLLTDHSGWEFAVINGDSHAGKWCQEQKRLDYDRSVDDVLKHINPGDTVIDAGAFIGAYTIPIAKAVGPTGQVWAFEPNLDSFICLSVNCRDLCPPIRPINKILGLFESTDSIGLWDKQPLNMGACHVVQGVRASGSVDVLPLDFYRLNRCDFMKIDVEGYEPYVIRGATETIKKFRPKIFIELNDATLGRYGFNKNDVLNLLFKLGYRMEFINPAHKLTDEHIDVFFFPK